MAALCRKFSTLSLQISCNLPKALNQATYTARGHRTNTILQSSVRSITSLTRSKKKEDEMSSTQKKLMKFFDEKDNWLQDSVKTGRPWKPDELRLKSYSDLHKLWYVLLKERNMLLTMEEEYRRNYHLMPSPERIYKVEESMENLAEVLQERNIAVQELEQGEASPDVKPRQVWHINVLGVGHMKYATEHRIPKEIHTEYNRWRSLLSGRWTEKYLRLLREKKLGKLANRTYKYEQWKRKMRQKFPSDDFDS